MLLYLLAARTRRCQILLAVAFNFRLPALPALDLIAQTLQARGEFRAIHRCRVLLRFVQFPWLQRVGFAVRCLRKIKEDDVRMQLRRGIAVYRSCAVMLEFCCYPFACRLCGKIPADASLDIALQFIERDGDAFSMCVPHSFIPAYERRQRYALRCRKRRIPARAMFHRAYFLAACAHVFTRRLVADELL